MKFSQKNIENWQSWKMTFFWVGHFEFFFCKKKKNFASSPWKLVTNYVLEWMGLNFQYYDGLQPKIRAGIINEHECTYPKVASLADDNLFYPDVCLAWFEYKSGKIKGKLLINVWLLEDMKHYQICCHINYRTRAIITSGYFLPHF